MSGGLEFRVFTGGQAGCRLPLKPGLYRAGAGPACDILLERYPQGQIAFVLYVGHQEVALEAVDGELSLGGQPAQGLRPLTPGQVFALGERLFAVDHPGEAWPENPVVTIAETPAETVDEARQETPGAAPADATPAAPQEPAAEPAPAPVAITPSDAPRRHLPFWALWLGGTALFLGVGILVLFLSLRPAPAPDRPDPGRIALALEQLIAATRGHAELRLEPQPGGRLKLAGYVATREQKAELARAARAIAPSLLLQVSADEDMEGLVRDTLARFDGEGIEFAGLRFGELTLQGHVAAAALRDRVGETLFDDVPGLRLIHANVSAADDALVTMRDLLAEAGLDGHIAGRLDGNRLVVGGSPSDAERRTWNDIRRRLAARFGAALEIVENFRTVSPQRNDVVLAVRGKVPYVVLANGDKEGRSTEDLPQ
ncbi:type III secretion system inner membrane ring subunit SctD [Pseudothauera rhizosphaerae]|uniref:EscD/YscD/HrpQ family type III secretion system inner membrane ring protein n=1 Tax=Pseudothauera rhizosphaerae TaxID=2565932 RepID=A0A4S4ADS8_9RHOO|nr:type III secretion system inner membrane ring subunit SctD [Pseudothauera rhizosphaerae]THF57252.1 EscD/YscD/HrpQ family type III secretion system inner membrane ring protein [Pseudothauera rhizosphaerae]